MATKKTIVVVRDDNGIVGTECRKEIEYRGEKDQILLRVCEQEQLNGQGQVRTDSVLSEPGSELGFNLQHLMGSAFDFGGYDQGIESDAVHASWLSGQKPGAVFDGLLSPTKNQA